MVNCRRLSSACATSSRSAGVMLVAIGLAINMARMTNELMRDDDAGRYGPLRRTAIGARREEDAGRLRPAAGPSRLRGRGRQLGRGGTTMRTGYGPLWGPPACGGEDGIGARRSTSRFTLAL